MKKFQKILFGNCKHHNFWCLLLFLKLFSFEASIKAQSIGILNENGKIDTISQLPLTKEHPYEFCKDQCYQFVNIINPNIDPTQKLYHDTIVWVFDAGIPSVSFEKDPRICFNEISNFDTLYVKFYVTIFFPPAPPQSGWESQSMISIVKDCPPVAEFTIEEYVICPDQVINFKDSSYRSPEIWEWKFEGGTPSKFMGQDPPEIKYKDPGLFEVSLSVYNKQGGDTLVKKSIIQVLNGPMRDDEIQNTYSGVYGSDAIITSCVKGDTYQWFPSEGLSCDDCDSPVLTFGHISEYTSIVPVNGGACVDSCKITIRTESEEPKIFFPNIISPNYDGVNDIFEGSWTFADPVQLNIYDRWGGVKFLSKSDFKWDATYNGQEVSPGLYLYYFVFKNLFSGLDEVKSGSITVLR